MSLVFIIAYLLPLVISDTSLCAETLGGVSRSESVTVEVGALRLMGCSEVKSITSVEGCLTICPCGE